MSTWAKPPAPATFCAKYPTAQTCIGGQPACTYCHTSPPTRNAFGMSVESTLLPGAMRPLSDGDFQMALPAALSAAESLDSDGDGVSNLLEIQKGTLPGDPGSLPRDVPCGAGTNPSYSVCKYDNRYVYRKMVIDFCGGSPAYADLEAFGLMTSAEQTARSTWCSTTA